MVQPTALRHASCPRTWSALLWKRYSQVARFFLPPRYSQIQIASVRCMMKLPHNTNSLFPRCKRKDVLYCFCMFRLLPSRDTFFFLLLGTKLLKLFKTIDKYILINNKQSTDSISSSQAYKSLDWWYRCVLMSSSLCDRYRYTVCDCMTASTQYWHPLAPLSPLSPVIKCIGIYNI